MTPTCTSASSRRRRIGSSSANSTAAEPPFANAISRHFRQPDR